MIIEIIFLFSVIWFIIYCFSDDDSIRIKSVNDKINSNQTLTEEQIQELNNYFKALTRLHFKDYEHGEESTLELLNFGSQLIQLEYPAMIDQVNYEEQAYLSFDKRMLLSIIDQYFNEKVTAVGMYVDLGDYIIRPDINVKTDTIYPQFKQRQLNEDGTYTIDFDLYETTEALDEDFDFTFDWHTRTKCRRVGAASVIFYYEDSEGYLLSYHPIYFDEYQKSTL